MSTPDTSTNRESSFSTVECVVVTCACCGVRAFDDDKSEWAGVIHFDDREKAVENITSRDLDQPWQVEGDQAYCGDWTTPARTPDRANDGWSTRPGPACKDHGGTAWRSSDSMFACCWQESRGIGVEVEGRPNVETTVEVARG